MESVRIDPQDAPSLLTQLERLCHTLGISLKLERLSVEGDRLTIRSGLVRLRDKEIFIIDDQLAAAEKCRVIAHELKDRNLRHVFMSPAVRRLIEGAAGDDYHSNS